MIVLLKSIIRNESDLVSVLLGVRNCVLTGDIITSSSASLRSPDSSLSLSLRNHYQFRYSYRPSLIRSYIYRTMDQNHGQLFDWNSFQVGEENYQSILSPPVRINYPTTPPVPTNIKHILGDDVDSFRKLIYTAVDFQHWHHCILCKRF